MFIYFEFDYKKATQALNYIAQNFGGEVNKMKAIKLIWAADRYHLRKYGRSITNDEYYAMKKGPVGSKIRDLIELTPYLEDSEKDYRCHYITSEECTVYSKKEIDRDVFSESDIEVLNFIIDRLGKFNQFQLVEISHAYPEWKKHKNILESDQTTRKTMHYEDFFNDPDINEPEIQEFLNGNDIFAMPEEDKEDIMEYVKEQQDIERLWE